MFKQWLEQAEAWEASKEEIIALWRSLKDRPIRPTPIPHFHKGSTYGQDTVRVTGTGDFVNSVLARIKDLLQYDAPGMELDVTYEQMVDKNEIPVPGKFVCYIKVRQKAPMKISVNP